MKIINAENNPHLKITEVVLVHSNIVNSDYQHDSRVLYTFVPDCSRFVWREWPSGLRRCDQNRKVPGSNPTRRSAGLRDPTSLRGSR